MTGARYRRLVFQPDVLHGMQRGIDVIADAVSPTLGPRPRFAAVAPVIQGKPIERLDNAGLIARRIQELPDRDADVGAMLLREMLWQLHETYGDGTATAAVLFQSVFRNGVRYLTSGGDAMLLRRHLEQGLQVIGAQLAAATLRLSGSDGLAKIAESVCHDAELARELGEIFDVIGEHGELDVRTGYERGLRHDFVDGASWDGGLVSKEMLRPAGAGVIALENPAIVLSNLRVTDPEDLVPAVEAAYQSGARALVFVVSHMSDLVSGFLVKNGQGPKFRMIAVKTPGDLKSRGGLLDDMAALTGGQPLILEAQDSLTSIRPERLGHARRVWANESRFGIVGGQGDPGRARDQFERLARRLEQIDDRPHEALLRERLGKFGGGSAVLWIGGVTVDDIKARKDVAERTARALRAALHGGILPGGGTALLGCRAALEQRRLSASTSEERAAYRILRDVMEIPARLILTNAGFNASEHLAEVSARDGWGFDVVSGRAVDVMDAGIFDVATAYQMAVHNAISAAAQALTVSVVVHPRKQEMVLNR